jgi:hypothetical protein
VGSLAPGKYRVLVFADTPVDPGNAGALFRANWTKGEEVTLESGGSKSLTVHAVDRKE